MKIKVTSMRVDVHMNDSFSVKMGFNAPARCINPGQPAQSSQADLLRNVFAVCHCSAYQRNISSRDTLSC